MRREKDRFKLTFTLYARERSYKLRHIHISRWLYQRPSISVVIKFASASDAVARATLRGRVLHGCIATVYKRDFFLHRSHNNYIFCYSAVHFNRPVFFCFFPYIHHRSPYAFLAIARTMVQLANSR